MRSQGRAFVQWTNREERARFITYVQAMIDQWRYAENGRTYPKLSEQTGISTDQISKWLRGTQVPSSDSVEKLFKAGVFDVAPSLLKVSKPWMEFEPDVNAMVEPPARNRGKKPSSKKSSAPTAPAAPAVEVAAPPIEFAAPNIHDAIALMDIPVAAKQRLSAIAALVEVGADVNIEITVRAR